MPTPAGADRIPAGDHSLYAEWHGSGTATVLIEVGSTMPGTSDPGWQPIVQKLAREMNVVLYDRASLGRSDPAPRPRKLANFTRDLRSILADLASTPIVLVGGSFGGMIATDYASRYPGDISGLLLIDSTHPTHNLRTLPLLPPESPAEPPSLTAFRQEMWREQYAPLETGDWEGLDAADAIEQAKDWDLGDVPLAVLTAGANEWEPDFPAEVADIYEKEWLQMQRELAALSANSLHRVVTDSDHLIHCRRPDAVIAAIRALAYRVSLAVLDERPKLKCP